MRYSFEELRLADYERERRFFVPPSINTGVTSNAHLIDNKENVPKQGNKRLPDFTAGPGWRKGQKKR